MVYAGHSEGGSSIEKQTAVHNTIIHSVTYSLFSPIHHILIALKANRKIGQLGVVMFALCRDKKFKEDPAEAASNTPTLLKVYLPNESGFVSVVPKDDMTLRQLREIVCAKRSLNPDR